MSNDGKHLYALLREALWMKGSAIAPLSVSDAAELLKDAKKQGVLLMVVDALNRLGVKLPLQVIHPYLSSIQWMDENNGNINRAARGLARLFDKNQIDYVVVKGQAVACYYPKPLLRQAGDIDFYCDSRNYAPAVAVLRDKWKAEFVDADSDHDYNFTLGGVLFEFHYKLLNLYGSKNNAYWEQLLAADPGDEPLIDGQKVKTLSPTVHALYVFLHLYHHLLELGIGIRQFCDLAILLNTPAARVDLPVLHRHLENLGMARAFRACGSILVDCLGVPEDKVWPGLTASDHRNGRRILDVVDYRGNLGHYNKKNGSSGWRHNIEATFIKVVHFVKFMPLAPSLSCRWLAHELKRKVLYKAGVKESKSVQIDSPSADTFQG